MYGDGSIKRDYTYIDDIVAGIKGAINYTKTGYEIINLGGDEPITLKRMIGTIETAVGKPAIIEQKPMQLGVWIKRFVIGLRRVNFTSCTKTTFEK